MMNLKRHGWLILSCVAGVLAAACHSLTFQGARPMPGNGPNGSDVRSSSQIAVGMSPTPAAPLVYPLTARVNVKDNYHETVVEDPYRWLEDLDSDATRHWVESENQLAKPRLESIPHRAWVKQRLAALWNYERFTVPVQHGGHYFFLHSDGTQNQNVLFVTDQVDSPGRVLFDPNTVREDATVSLSEYTPNQQGTVVGYALSDGGTDWQTWKFRRVADGHDLTDTLRFTKFFGISWAHDGSGVYYDRYPPSTSIASPDGKGNDAGRPAIYFHRLGESQDQDRLVYEVTDHPTRVPVGRVTSDGCYLVITMFDGYEKNAVSILDLRKPGASASPLFHAWDALYDFIGSKGDKLYFTTTKNAPQRRIIVVDAQQPVSTLWPTVVPEQNTALDSAEYVGDRLIAKYVQDAHAVVRIYDIEGKPLGEVALPGLGDVSGFSGEAGDTRDLLFVHRLPDAVAGFPLRREVEHFDVVAQTRHRCPYGSVRH